MKRIACLGSGNGEPGDKMYDAMQEVGKLLAKNGITVLTGGFGGSGMEAPAKGVQSSGGKSVGFTLMGIPGNQYLSETVDTKKQSDIPEIQFGIRLGNLLSADGFIISADGGAGTMTELMAIINLNAKFWKPSKPVVILNHYQEEDGYPIGDILHSLKKWGMLPDSVKVEVVFSPEKAVKLLLG
ncbi:LOG family protein [Patescibacteria group bacterium]